MTPKTDAEVCEEILLEMCKQQGFHPDEADHDTARIFWTRCLNESPVVRELIEALEFYADREMYRQGSGASEFTCEFGEVEEHETWAIMEDDGELAREALAKFQAARKGGEK